jgi:restriction system protein
MEHRKKMKLDQFERFLKTGRKQPLLDRMTGTEFVNFLADFFDNKGYHVRKNPPTHDFGADLIVDRFEETIAVQAKCRKQTVGIPAVQEVHGARDYYRTRRAMVISVGGFTKSAVKLANRLGVELWDRKRLLDEIKKFGF